MAYNLALNWKRGERRRRERERQVRDEVHLAPVRDGSDQIVDRGTGAAEVGLEGGDRDPRRPIFLAVRFECFQSFST